MPLCKHTNKNKLYNAIETTSNIPAGYYITAESTQDVEKFAQKLHGKFGHKDRPFYADEVVIEIFLHDLEHFLTDIYHKHFFFELSTKVKNILYIVYSLDMNLYVQQ